MLYIKEHILLTIHVTQIQMQNPKSQITINVEHETYVRQYQQKRCNELMDLNAAIGINNRRKIDNRYLEKPIIQKRTQSLVPIYKNSEGLKFEIYWEVLYLNFIA